MKRTANTSFICLISIFLCFGLFGCSSVDRLLYAQTRDLLGTFVTIKVPPQNADVVEKAFSAIKEVEGRLSRFKDDSIVVKVNKSNGDEILMTQDDFFLFSKAVYFYNITNGAFDITILPLIKLWNEAEKKKRLPSKTQIEETLDKVGTDKLVLDGRKKTLRLKIKGIKIDLGGIAKGYAVDRAVEILKESGVTSALIDAGGDIYCLGSRPDGKPWSIGVRNPIYKDKIVKAIRLVNRAIATSGSYENFYTIGGKRYSHIIDPRSGWPVDNELLSVTVIAPDCLTADALATSFFVLGKSMAKSLISKLEGIDVYFLTNKDLTGGKN